MADWRLESCLTCVISRVQPVYSIAGISKEIQKINTSGNGRVVCLVVSLLLDNAKNQYCKNGDQRISGCSVYCSVSIKPEKIRCISAIQISFTMNVC